MEENRRIFSSVSVTRRGVPQPQEPIWGSREREGGIGGIREGFREHEGASPAEAPSHFARAAGLSFSRPGAQGRAEGSGAGVLQPGGATPAGGSASDAEQDGVGSLRNLKGPGTDLVLLGAAKYPGEESLLLLFPSPRGSERRLGGWVFQGGDGRAADSLEVFPPGPPACPLPASPTGLHPLQTDGAGGENGERPLRTRGRGSQPSSGAVASGRKRRTPRRWGRTRVGGSGPEERSPLAGAASGAGPLPRRTGVRRGGGGASRSPGPRRRFPGAVPGGRLCRFHSRQGEKDTGGA
ncbi:cuticle collagen 13-like [Sarcophilus harrisii]|uniref:cuticle collagen 13-like n=1 Tax=Sarcophilus harrisii TaxID=9305 RepID=UPI001301FBB3|nr:cuticle collagen 13-like [Sarcophilus harrisii]